MMVLRDWMLQLTLIVLPALQFTGLYSTVLSSPLQEQVRSDLESLPDAFAQIYPRFRPTIDNLPEQIHLSLGEDAYSMVVMWATLDEYDEGPSYVHYGLGEDNFTRRSVAQAEDLRHGNPKGCKGIFHAMMTDLVPHRIHSYKVETGGHFSKVFTFIQPRAESNRSAGFLVYGDLGKLGGGYTVSRLISEAESGDYDGVLHVGDFAYNLYDDGGRRGDAFMNRIEPISSRIPYMHTPGNHEILYGFYHYRFKFSSPRTSWPIPLYKMWYSFDVGQAHFISYSTEVYFTYNQAYVATQYKWLEDDLIKANRNRAERPWIIVFGHRPMYCSNYNRDDCTHNISSLRKEPHNLERLFYTQGVDLIIEAHEHSYERLFPLYNGIQTDCGYTNPSAPVHIIAGSAGCNEREMMCADVFLDRAHHWSAKRSWLPGLNGYGKLVILNSTHLHWQQVMSISDQPMDDIMIIQHHHSVRDNATVTENRCDTL